jgi:hypothetical protein
MSRIYRNAHQRERIGLNAVPWTKPRICCFSFVSLIALLGGMTIVYFMFIQGYPHLEKEGSAFEAQQLLQLLNALTDTAQPNSNLRGIGHADFDDTERRGFDAALRFTAHYFHQSGISGKFLRTTMKELAPAGRMANLFLSTRYKSDIEPTHVKLLLIAHVNSPFALPSYRRVSDVHGRAFGSGIATARGPLAAMMYALKRLPQPDKYDVGVIITADPPTLTAVCGGR